MLRFRDGQVIRTDTQFGNTFHSALTVAGAFGGMIVISKPASCTLELPNNVAEDLPYGLQPEIEMIWQLGDPPLVLSTLKRAGLE